MHPLHRGVYAVGHTRLSYRGRLWAAVLACGGPGAAILSHRSAAAAWELLPTPAGPTDVTTLHAAHSMPGVRVHRTTTLDLEEDVVRQADGLPVTAVARTLQDLATVLSPHRLERVCHRAQHLRLLDAAVLGAQAGRGSRALANALATLENADPQITRGELEERFLVLIGEAQLPPPLVNAHIAGHEVDFLWPDHHLIAETDGAASHLTPTAFEADRRRDARLQAVGYRVVRFTYRQVTDQPIAVVTMLRRLLAPAPPPAPSDRSARPRASRGGRSP